MRINTFTTWVDTRNDGIRSLILTVPDEPYWSKQVRQFVRNNGGKVLYAHSSRFDVNEVDCAGAVIDRVGRNAFIN